MNDEQLKRILKYSSPKELFVVTWDNRLIKLNCPFKVKARYAINEVNQGEYLEVQEVKVTEDLITVFLIDSKYYFYHHFDIIID